MVGKLVARAAAVATSVFVLLLLTPALVAAASAAPSITKPTAGENIASSTPSFAGTTSDALDSITVSVYAGSAASGTPVQTLSPLVAESWEVTDGSSLIDGEYTVVAEQNSEVSAPVTFDVDVPPPVVTISPVAAWTKDSTPTLEGGAGDSSSVEVTVYEGTSASGTVASSGAATLGGGSWSYTPASALADGTYTARAAGRDAAGNLGESSTVTFTVDTVAPNVTLSEPANESILNFSRPTFAGSAGHASGDLPLVKLRVYSGPNTSGSLVETLEPIASGSQWSTGSTSSSLRDGIYTAAAEQADEAGNERTASITFAIKTNSPEVTLDTAGQNRADGFTTGPTPTFSGIAGTEPEDGSSVVVKIYSGLLASGTPVRTTEAKLHGSTWTVPELAPLPDGTYTAQAEQADMDAHGQTGYSSPLPFVVDADPPHVTISQPSQGSSTSSSTVNVSGAGGTAEGDSGSVTVQLFSGAGASGQSTEAITLTVSGGAWSGAIGGLAPGTYTVRAEQNDDVGNVGYSVPVSFTVTSPPSTPTPAPAPAPPVASFQWFPAAPHVGEQVSLVSTSSDAGSPIVAFSWALAPGLALTPGEHVLTTTFSTPGAHVVRLRVTDANGLGSEVAETVPVSVPELPLMQPFPVVRIAGSAKTSSITISLFTVLAPVGSKVSVTCHGHGCPTGHQSFVIEARRRGHGGTMLVSLTRFERSLGVGAVLQVKISKPGEIGKYTRFTVRRGKLPTRLDSCLSLSSTPMTCPST